MTPRRRRVYQTLMVAAVLLLIAGAVALSYFSRSPFLRDRVVDALNNRFRSQVQAESLQVAVFPRPEVSGTGLQLRHDGRTDVPPLISIRSYAGSAGVAGLFAAPLHLHSVDLEGLEIHIPPCGLDVKGGNPLQSY